MGGIAVAVLALAAHPLRRVIAQSNTCMHVRVGACVYVLVLVQVCDAWWQANGYVK